MGKRIIAQRRGSGSPKYRKPGFNSKAQASYAPLPINAEAEGIVKEIFRCPAHSSPIAAVSINGKLVHHIAPEGISVGQRLKYASTDEEAKTGNVLPLKDIPDGSSVFNIELIPGDGGKLVRASGTSARIISKSEKGVIIELPSKKEKRLDPKCRATIGVVAGGGRLDKPILKAGKMYYISKSKHKLFPKVSGAKMNAFDHPFGNKRSSRKSKARPVSRHAPPGRKVGYISPKRTGRKKK
ncbi:MAG: large subunit ribosomal protein [Candidatus Woesearchaeota archaeon]|nr:large subunit ribosomal protein [Candidatus Woesearchaeota archaeon]